MFTRNSLIFVNTTSIGYWQQVDRGPQNLDACKSSRVHIRQRITSSFQCIPRMQIQNI